MLGDDRPLLEEPGWSPPVDPWVWVEITASQLISGAAWRWLYSVKRVIPAPGGLYEDSPGAETYSAYNSVESRNTQLAAAEQPLGNGVNPAGDGYGPNFAPQPLAVGSTWPVIRVRVNPGTAENPVYDTEWRIFAPGADDGTC